MMTQSQMFRSNVVPFSCLLLFFALVMLTNPHTSVDVSGLASKESSCPCCKGRGTTCPCSVTGDCKCIKCGDCHK